MATQYIFGGDDMPQTPQELARLRAIAAALAPSKTPQNVGEGLTSLGNAISYRMMMNKADKAEKAGRESANAAFAPLANMFSSGASSGVAQEMGATSPASSMAAPSVVDISGDKETFVSSLLPAAIEESKRTGVDPRIIVAQAAQETGWGKSAPGNNFFGIKSHGQGGGQSLATHEYVDGKRVNVTDSFRTFESPAESVRGYGDFILQNPRYKPLREAQGLDAQLEALQASGYATDPNYSRSVGSIARGIQLPTEVASLDPSAGMTAPQAIEQQAPTAPDAVPGYIDPRVQAQPRQQVAQALTRGKDYFPPAPQAPQPGQVDMRAVFTALNNPFTTPGQKAVAEALLQQEQSRRQAILEQQLQQNDPKYQLDLRKGQVELERLINPQMSPAEAARLGLDREKFAFEQQTAGNTDDIREYQFYAEQEKAAGRQPLPPDQFWREMKRSAATNVTTNVGEGDKFYENLDKKNAETFAALSDGGVKAQSKLAQIGQLETLLSQSPQGAEAAIKQTLGDMGIATEGLDAIQATRALLEKMVPEQRPAGSGPMSDADIAMFRNSLPRLINQSGGNQMILGTMRSIAEYESQMGQIADQVADRVISPSEGRKMIRELKNPIDGFRDAMKGKPSTEMKAPEGVDPEVWNVMTPEERALWQ